MPRGIPAKGFRARPGEFTHGTQSGYNEHKCRCDECVTAAGGRPCPICGRISFADRACRECQQAGMLRAEYVCDHCGTQFRRAAHLEARFCGRSCASDYARAAAADRGVARKGRTCAQCGSTFDAGNKRQVCCSRECRSVYDEMRRKRYPSSRVYFPKCRGCSRLFTSRSAAKRWCSDRCWVGNQSERITSLYALACARECNGGQWRKRLIGYLVERDGPRCGICGRRVNLALKSGPRGDDRGPSIDHVVPRSQGGVDDLPNLRLAHWGCNRARRANGGNEQLALVG